MKCYPNTQGRVQLHSDFELWDRVQVIQNSAVHFISLRGSNFVCGDNLLLAAEPW